MRNNWNSFLTAPVSLLYFLCGKICGIGGLVMTTKGWGLYYPYSLYSMGMHANNPNLEPDMTVFIMSSIIYIILFSILSVTALKKHE